MTELNQSDGYIGGSYTDVGYVAIANDWTSEKTERVVMGKTLISLVNPTHNIMTKGRCIIHNDSCRELGYDTVLAYDPWHLVQFARSGGLFATPKEAENAVRRYIEQINKPNRKSNYEIYTYEDFNVEIKKVNFECSMRFEES